MIDYAVYDKDTGRVIRTGVTPQLETQVIHDNEAVVAGKALPSTHYVHNGALMARPYNPAVCSKTVIASDGSDEMVVSGIPTGSRVVVNGPVRGSTEVNDGEFIFTTEVPGEYGITVLSFPERNAMFQVVAT